MSIDYTINLNHDITKKKEIPMITGEWPDKGNLYLEEFLRYKKLDYRDNIYSAEKMKSILKKKDGLFKPEQIVDQIELVDQENRLARLKDFEDLGNVKISEEVYKEFENNKTNWNLIGKMTLEYTIERKEFFISNIEILEFQNDLYDWSLFESYSHFERVNILLLSLGYNPNELLFREKIFLLIRAIPLVQKNVNLMEITKREVGKSYLYSNLFFNDSVIKTSSNSTEAQLFGGLNDKNKIKSDFLSYNVVCFDEIHKATLKPEIMQEIQIYAESGKISRTKAHGDASLIFFGNLDESIVKKIHVGNGLNIFENLSSKSQASQIDAAFLDRMHFFIPTFGMRNFENKMLYKNNKELFNSDRIPVGFLSKIFRELRNLEISDTIFKKLGYEFKDMSTRDAISISKITLGLLKLIFPEIIKKIKDSPNVLLTDDFDNINAMLYLAMEGRYIIKKQINIASGFNEEPKMEIIHNYRIIKFGDSLIFARLYRIFLNFDCPHNYSHNAHRILLSEWINLKKIPLDSFGIEANEREMQFLNSRGIKINGTYYNDGNYIGQYGDSTYNIPNHNHMILTHNVSVANGYYNIHNRLYSRKKNGELISMKNENKNYLFGYSYRNELNNLDDNFIYNDFSGIHDFEFYCKENNCGQHYRYFERVNSEEFKCRKCGKTYFSFEIAPELF